MNESPRSTETGRRVYASLLKARDSGRKRVYVLASHQHFYMADVYDSQYLREHGGVLPGWVIGTAGAQRYSAADAVAAGRNDERLWIAAGDGRARRRNQVRVPEGRRSATFRDVIVRALDKALVRWCFASNTLVV